MNLKKNKMLFGGVASVMASVLTLSTTAYSVALSPLAVGWVDGYFGVESRQIWEDREVIGVQAYKKNHKTITEFADAMVAHGEKQGEEGFALLKNDNKALPLAKGANVALFGWNCYNTPAGHTGVVAGNKTSDASAKGGAFNPYVENITIASALGADADVKVNSTITKDDFTGAMASASWGEYTIKEVFEEKSNWKIDANTTAIVAVGRGGGEGANYKVDAATNASDPLALSTDEIAMIKYAKEHCAKVVVLVVSANAMELGPIAKGGELEVDAIGFCAIPNDYSYGGIAKVLTGKANASGGLTDTYVYDNSFTPASINMGQQTYTDTDSIGFSSIEQDPFKRSSNGNPLTAQNLNARYYIVEAEGIYVGYKYYETRYYDAMVDAAGTNATATIGSTTGKAWNYSDEVVYTFGHGLSYIPYEQEVTNVKVDLSENGQTVATVKVTNKGTEAGKFNAQLYVSRPYTQYDKTNKVEKSAIDFLNSAKVELKAGESKEVEISLPTRYLASYDSNGAKTYILDEGAYYFTAANGAHEAVNNVLAKQGKTTDGTTTAGAVVTWNELKELDKNTFYHSNGYVVTNVADNTDINYYLPGAVTYLTRADWKTFPKNYTDYTNDSGIASEKAFTIASSPKKDEWLRELRNLQYVPTTNDPQTNVEGILPAEVKSGEYTSVWNWITSYKLRNPDAFADVTSDIWKEFAQALNINESVGAILHGGNTSDTLSVGNPSSAQSESVAGYSQTLTITGEGDDAKKMKANIASNTLLGASFNPDLAYEWGLLEGETGLWLMDQQQKPAITVWGAGLNLHRHAYNGRNSEYVSEDPMLANRIGEAQMRGSMEMGAINGPKHMGFNDQELNRQGNAAYMTEQKMRETDIRCYEGALRAEEGNGNGVMMSFCRIGATNVTNHTGLMVDIMRHEWAFDGITTTDMGQANYHEPFAIINARICQYAGFGANDSFIGANGTDFSDDAKDKSWAYVTMAVLKGDKYITEAARETITYQLFTIANSASYNMRAAKEGEQGEKMTMNVYVGDIAHANWEYIFISAITVSAVLTALAGCAWVASVVMPGKED